MSIPWALRDPGAIHEIIVFLHSCDSQNIFPLQLQIKDFNSE